jgi:hypothetical protein
MSCINYLPTCLSDSLRKRSHVRYSISMTTIPSSILQLYMQWKFTEINVPFLLIPVVFVYTLFFSAFQKIFMINKVSCLIFTKHSCPAVCIDLVPITKEKTESIVISSDYFYLYTFFLILFIFYFFIRILFILFVFLGLAYPSFLIYQYYQKNYHHHHQNKLN